MEWLTALMTGESPWGWLVLAASLFALDIYAPGFYLVWFGVASSGVGLLLFAMPL
jgi:membrane protein implicated in regulation of membrane protease activity